MNKMGAMDKYTFHNSIYCISNSSRLNVNISALYWLNDTSELETTTFIIVENTISLHCINMALLCELEFEWYNIILLCITN